MKAQTRAYPEKARENIQACTDLVRDEYFEWKPKGKDLSKLQDDSPDLLTPHPVALYNAYPFIG